MTAINLKNIIEIAQRKIAVVDSNSSTRDLENLMEITMLTGGGHKADSAGFDSDVSNYVGRVVFIDSGSEGFFKFNQTIAGAPSATPNQNFTQIVQGGTYTTNPAAGPSATAFTVASINGSAYGYRQGGFTPYVNRIDKYSYTSDGNATDVGDLLSSPGSVGNFAYTGSSSTKAYGYSHGGYPNAAEQKYSHTSDGNATAIPGLATTAYWSAGHTSDTNIYISMFYNALSPTIGSPNWNDDIGKAPIASEDAWSAVSTTWSNTIGGSTGQMAQSYTDAYAAGGVSAYPQPGNTAYNTIEKFPFASEGTTNDVGDLSTVRLNQTHNSYENNYGYSTGGRTASPAAKTNVIEKYPFASSGNATDVGDLLGSTDGMSGTNSTASGYSHGGIPSQNVIQKFSFTSDGNATDVGDLLDSKYFTGGSQV